MNTGLLRHAVATVLTVYGIETAIGIHLLSGDLVATVLTVYGIETSNAQIYTTLANACCNSAYRLRY